MTAEGLSTVQINYMNVQKAARTFVRAAVRMLGDRKTPYPTLPPLERGEARESECPRRGVYGGYSAEVVAFGAVGSSEEDTLARFGAYFVASLLVPSLVDNGADGAV